MKTTLLFIVGFFALVLIGCNNNPGKATTTSLATDTAITTLTDLSASTDIKKLLCQNWENKEDAEDAALSGGGDELEMPYRGLSFFEDASAVENPRDKIRFGKWGLNETDKLIDIEFNKGAKTQYKIVAIGAKQMVLMNMGDKKKVEYRADGKVQQNLADNPFYAGNNQWRMKPGKPETDSAIRQRTEQSLLFYAKFLADNAGRKATVITFAGLPGCFKWYRGGVSVKGKDKLDEKWINCYYSKEQALKAHAMLETIISKKYKWNKEEKNWVMQSADVVHQMYDTLKLL